MTESKPVDLSLKTKVLESGIKQYHLGRLAGIEEKRLSKIIHRRITPRNEEKDSIARVLGCSACDLFADTSKSK